MKVMRRREVMKLPPHASAAFGHFSQQLNTCIFNVIKANYFVN
jgi:hypothetical protein